MIPVSCDALLYHWPICTVLIIVANVAAFVGTITGNILPEDGWILQWGSGIHPQQWLLSIFMHADAMHLLGNMFFLWVFGLVTEGKLGWWRFLICYLTIGIGQSAIEQLLVSDPKYVMLVGSCGASAAIFGLMAMACVWAPMNEVTVVGMFYYRGFSFEVSIGILAAIYVGLDILQWLFLGVLSGGAWLHLLGVALGGLLGVLLLKKGVVECEGWDLFHVIRGDYGPDAVEENKDPTEEELASRQEKQSAIAEKKFRAYLEIDQPSEALALRKKMVDVGRPIFLSRDDLMNLIVGLHKHHQWSDSAPLMAEYLDQYPDNSERVRLKLAQICLVELERPSKALELLEPLQGIQLSATQDKLFHKLRKVAKHQVASGSLEIEDQPW